MQSLADLCSVLKPRHYSYNLPIDHILHKVSDWAYFGSQTADPREPQWIFPATRVGPLLCRIRKDSLTPSPFPGDAANADFHAAPSKHTVAVFTRRSKSDNTLRRDVVVVAAPSAVDVLNGRRHCVVAAPARPLHEMSIREVGGPQPGVRGSFAQLQV